MEKKSNITIDLLIDYAMGDTSAREMISDDTMNESTKDIIEGIKMELALGEDRDSIKKFLENVQVGFSEKISSINIRSKKKTKGRVLVWVSFGSLALFLMVNIFVHFNSTSPIINDVNNLTEEINEADPFDGKLFAQSIPVIDSVIQKDIKEIDESKEIILPQFDDIRLEVIPAEYGTGSPTITTTKVKVKIPLKLPSIKIEVKSINQSSKKIIITPSYKRRKPPIAKNKTLNNAKNTSTDYSGNQTLRGIVWQFENQRTPIQRASVYVLGVDNTHTIEDGSFALDLSKCIPGSTIIIRVSSDHGIGEYTYNVPNRISGNINIYVSQSNKLVIPGILKDRRTNRFIEEVKVTLSISGYPLQSRITNEFGQYEFILNHPGIGERQAATLSFLDLNNKRYKDYSEVVYTSKTTIPQTIYLDKCTDCLKKYELKVHRGTINNPLISNIKVKKGDTILIRANGKMNVGKWVGSSGPEGRKNGIFGLNLSDYKYFKNWNYAVLCYRIGAHDEWKYFDNNRAKNHPAEQDGYLEFMINDNLQSDNSGAYKIEVEIRK